MDNARWETETIELSKQNYFLLHSELNRALQEHKIDEAFKRMAMIQAYCGLYGMIKVGKQ